MGASFEHKKSNHRLNEQELAAISDPDRGPDLSILAKSVPDISKNDNVCLQIAELTVRDIAHNAACRLGLAIGLASGRPKNDRDVPKLLNESLLGSLSPGTTTYAIKKIALRLAETFKEVDSLKQLIDSAESVLMHEEQCAKYNKSIKGLEELSLNSDQLANQELFYEALRSGLFEGVVVPNPEVSELSKRIVEIIIDQILDTQAFKRVSEARGKCSDKDKGDLRDLIIAAYSYLHFEHLFSLIPKNVQSQESYDLRVISSGGSYVASAFDSMTWSQVFTALSEKGLDVCALFQDIERLSQLKLRMPNPGQEEARRVVRRQALLSEQIKEIGGAYQDYEARSGLDRLGQGFAEVLQIAEAPSTSPPFVLPLGNISFVIHIEGTSRKLLTISEGNFGDLIMGVLTPQASKSLVSGAEGISPEPICDYIVARPSGAFMASPYTPLMPLVSRDFSEETVQILGDPIKCLEQVKDINLAIIHKFWDEHPDFVNNLKRLSGEYEIRTDLKCNIFIIAATSEDVLEYLPKDYGAVTHEAIKSLGLYGDSEGEYYFIRGGMDRFLELAQKSSENNKNQVEKISKEDAGSIQENLRILNDKIVDYDSLEVALRQFGVQVDRSHGSGSHWALIRNGYSYIVSKNLREGRVRLYPSITKSVLRALHIDLREFIESLV